MYPALRVINVSQGDGLAAYLTARPEVLVAIEELVALYRERSQQDMLGNPGELVVGLDRFLEIGGQRVVR
ncbi:MAG: hypothetical protein GY708_19695 [Actinomycetia bacterium]|nr:hypothetical protein [Actinomycetes bacterium]MCP4084639.1 hypothetical protein [Actinomycetes bacterium]